MQTRAVLVEAELERGDRTFGELVQRTGLSVGDVYRALSELKHAGVCVEKRYHLEPEREA